jgi:rfaE bifunctional protein kinase chain/domain
MAMLPQTRPEEPDASARDALGSVVELIRARAPKGARVVFVSGNFNIVHPGHLRLLRFARECGDFLVVGVNSDQNGLALLPEEMRLDGVRSIGFVDYAFVLTVPPEQALRVLRPAIVVKGKEHEHLENLEREAVESYGGKLLFGSGEVQFSSLHLLQRELRETNFSAIAKPRDFLERHGCSLPALVEVVRRFAGLRLLVVGDLIVDEYISCEPLGMSQEDPTIVVSPIRTDRFVGGAGIVAAHARGLGASVRYFGVAGRDDTAAFARDRLGQYGVLAELVVDESRPTTLKQRYRAGGKTLLRVSQLRQHDISAELCAEMEGRIRPMLQDADLVVFSDFNYGSLPQALVDRLREQCAGRGIMMAADSQASSQLGDVSRFKGMSLLTPTEHEARLAVRDFSSGLVVLAEKLRRAAGAQQLLITLGAEGMLIHAAPQGSTQFVTDQLPAFNTAPKDVSGAGDSLLTCAAMALAVKANVWESAYLGSVAAACQVSRVGNTPLTAHELITELQL